MVICICDKNIIVILRNYNRIKSEVKLWVECLGPMELEELQIQN
jgi:hypothetical protein